MAQTIKLKRSSVSGNTPSTSDLSLGEIGINTYDGKIFIKKDDGSASIVEVGGSSGTVTETFKTIAVSGQTSVVADSATDTLTFVAGTNMSITTSAGGDSVTFASTGSSGSATFIGLSDSPSNFSGAAGKYLKVNSSANALEYDTLTFSDIGSTPSTLAGYGITDSLQLGTSSTTALAGNTSIPAAITDLSISDGSSGQVLQTDGSGNFSFTNQTGGGGNSFSTIAVSGQTSVVADQGSDTLTLVAGNNVTLSTNAGGDSITIASTADGGSGVIGQFLYTATAGQTAFSGNDDNNDSLVYVIGSVQVFLNGILLDPDTDYTATNGVLLTLVSAAAANDLVQLFSFNKKIGDANVTVNSYSGNGSTTGFTLSINPGDETNTRVYVDGVYQSKSNYSVSGTTLTFSTAPPSGTTIEVESGNRSVTIPTTENLDFPDNVKLRLGTSQDLEIYHNSSDSLINDNGTGSLKLQTGGSTKLEVISTGVDVTGNIVVSGTVDGIDIAARDAVLTSTTTTAGAALPKTGGAMTGAITTNSTFDGRDVATDGTKLDGIETSATADQTQSEINALGITATGLSGTPAISVANITTTGELRGPASLVIDPAGVGDNTGTVVIKGNLQVDGSQTTINSTTLTVDDLNLTLASGAANGTAANGAGLTIDGASATLTYASAGDKFVFNKRLDVTGAITASGNVGIGTTAPAQTLHVSSTGATSNGIRISNSEGSFETRVDQGEFYLYDVDDNRIPFLIDTAGKVGIGTVTPQHKLDTVGTIRHTSNIVSNTVYKAFSIGSNRTVNDYGGLNKDYWAISLATPGSNTDGGSSAHGYGALKFSGVSASDTALDDVLVLNYNGNVGIGTSAPSELLEVRKDSGNAIIKVQTGGGNDARLILDAPAAAGAQSQIFFDASGTTAGSIMYTHNSGGTNFMTFGTGGSNTERMRIDSSGNVNIGTAGYGTYSSGDRVLSLGSGTTIRGAASGVPYLTAVSNGYFDGTNWKYAQNHPATNYEQYNGSHTFSYAASGTAGNNITFSEAMRITGAGNIHLNTGVDARVQLGTSGTGASSVSDNSVYVRGNDDDLILGAAGNGNISFKENADTRMFIKTGGNVGIGITAPAHPLHVYEGAGGYYASIGRGNSTPGGADPWLGLFNNVSIADATYGWGMYDSSSDGSFQLWGKNNSTTGYNALTIKRGGNVGIGTTSPGARLHAYTTGYPVAKFERYGSSTATRGWTQLGHSSLGYSGATGADTYIVAQHGIGFAVNEGTNAMTITDGGKVGIGTNNPGSKLEVKSSGSTTNEIALVHSGNTVKIASLAQESSHGSLHLRANSGADKIRLSAGGNSSYILGSNLGIGTSSPADPLHVQFSNNTGADTGIIVKNTNTGTTSNFAGVSTQAVNGSVLGTFSSADYDAWGVGTFAGSQSNHPTYLIANNAVKMTITSAGNVGIGTTSPDSKLHLKDTASNSIVQTTWENDARKWSFGVHGGLSDAINLYDHTASASRFTVLSDGNVGIGETGPAYRLHIDGANVSSGGGLANLCLVDRTAYNGTLPGAGITFRGEYTSGGNTTNFATIQGIKENTTSGNYNTALRFTTRANGSNLTEQMRITSAGKVGIGTTAPQKKFHVEHTAGASEGILISGASDTVGHTAGILLRAEGGEADSALRAKAGIFLERVSGSYGVGKLHIANRHNGDNTSATISDANITIYDDKVGIGTTSPSNMLSVNGVITSGNFTAAGISGTPGDANTAELGPGYINLARDDTADAAQLSFGKNGATHSYLETRASGLGFVADTGFSFEGSLLAVGVSRAGLGTSNNRKLWVKGSAAFESHSTGTANPSLLNNTAIYLGPSGTRATSTTVPGTMGYADAGTGLLSGGIAWDHLRNYQTYGNLGYGERPHCWLGSELHSTPGYELSNMIMATREGTANTSEAKVAMRWNATGEITTPRNPAFHAYGTSMTNQTSEGNHGSWVEVHDRGANFAAGTNAKFTAPVDGVYAFYAHCNFNNNSSRPFYWRAVKNLANMGVFYGDGDGGTWSHISGFITVVMDKNDTFEWRYKGDPDEGNNWCQQGGYLIG